MRGRRCVQLLALGALAAFVLTAAACGERSEPVGAPRELFPLTVTSAGDRPVAIQAPARRIALLDERSRTTLDALGAGARIVGVPVTESGHIDVAALRRLRPDLVVAQSATDERVLSKAAAATSASVYLVPDTSIREVERAITQLGLITGEPTAARRLVRKIEHQRRVVARQVRGTLRVTAFVDLGYFTTASDSSLIGDLLREARARNVAGSVADGGPFDLAELRDLDPQVYIATTESGTTVKTLRSNPATRKLRAVENRRVVIVDGSLLEPGPSIGEGLEQLARALHPRTAG